MTQLPKTISSRSVYSNQFLNIKVDTLELHGKQWEQAYFTKPNKNCVGVLPIDENGVYLLHQYRYASQQYLWQLPMGMMDKEKTQLETAKAELQEEAGFIAEELTQIGSYILEPGMSPQELFLYVAKSLTKTNTSLADSEIGMKMQYFTFVELKQMIKDNEIKCGITLSALHLLFNNYLI